MNDDGNDGAIRARLLQPAQQLTIAEFSQLWFVERIEAIIPGYGKLANDPGLPGRIRGAFGTALAAGASKDSLDDQPCQFEPPCAFEALFRKQGRMMAGLDFPSPWVIGVEPIGADLRVTLSLFGFACDWAAAATEVFTRALAELVEWNSGARLFLPKFAIARRSSTTITGVSAALTAREVELELVSPLVLTGRDPRERPESLITGLGARVSGLARWHDVGLDEMNDWKALRSEAGALRYTFEAPEKVSWQRGSRRQDRGIPMAGLLGRLVISGDLGDIGTLIAMGETCHMGADVALGCGRYRIIRWEVGHQVGLGVG
jgi:hypothetical protein